MQAIDLTNKSAEEMQQIFKDHAATGGTFYAPERVDEIRQLANQMAPNIRLVISDNPNVLLPRKPEAKADAGDVQASTETPATTEAATTEAATTEAATTEAGPGAQEAATTDQNP
jgi:hypothetical protein